MGLERFGFIRLQRLRKGGRLSKRYPFPIVRPLEPSMQDLIRSRVEATRALGPQSLWTGYQQPGATREPAAVETTEQIGKFYASLVRTLRPRVIVELGTAFGVSGMYWLSGLQENQFGKLHTFEVNDKWAEIARTNLASVGNRFRLWQGLFEDCMEEALGNQKIDIAFIDGVHTSEWVIPQVSLIKERLAPGGIVVLDDINFSKDMESCWIQLSMRSDICGVYRLTDRVGILEFNLKV